MTLQARTEGQGKDMVHHRPDADRNMRGLQGSILLARYGGWGCR